MQSSRCRFSWCSPIALPSRLKGSKRLHLIPKQIGNPVGSLRKTVLVLATGAVLLAAGCSRGLVVGHSVPGTLPECEKAADDAMRRGDFQAGVILHERFLVDHPDNGLALYHLGFAYGQLGDQVNEVAYYEKAIKAGFKDENILFNLGMAYGEQGQMNKAVDAFQQALKISPGSADNHFGLALIYQSAAADEPAKRELLKAIEMDPGFLEARLHLAMLFANQGQFEEAKRQLKKVLDLDPANEVARETLAILERQ